MGQFDFVLQVKFSFLCFFVQRDNTVTVLLPDLTKPVAGRPGPKQPHYPIFRFPRERELPLRAGETRKNGKLLEDFQFRLGSDLTAVQFDHEDLEIRPGGTKLQGPTAQSNEFQTLVFDMSRLADSDPQSDPSVFTADQKFLGVNLDTTLAARIGLTGGRLEIDDDDVAPGEFALFPLTYKVAKTNIPPAGVQPFKLTRAVTWSIPVAASEIENRHVEFHFKKKGSSTLLRLAPADGEQILRVDIRNCEDEEIDRPVLPTGYLDDIHDRELLAYYPLLAANGQNTDIPKYKIVPLSNNGSGVCAPGKSS